jgi:hypothetical protein
MDWTDRYKDNAVALYLVGARVESWMGHLLYWLWFLVVFIHLGKCWNRTSVRLRPLAFKYFPILHLSGSRGSVAGMATGYGLDYWGVGVRVPLGSRIFFSPRRPDRLWCPPSLLSNGLPGALFPVSKAARHEADHSPPASAEVKKMWIYTSIPPYTFIA